MAIVPVQTQDTLDKVYLSETTKQVFDKINQNSAQEDIRADRTDANFQYLDTEVQSKQPSFSDGSAGIASVSNDIVTLKSGVTQSGGTISNSSGSDIVLAKVAKTGAYVDLSGQPTIPTKDSDLTNNRYVRYDTGSQGLTDTQKSNARTNIGAGTVASVGATSGSGIAIGGTATAPTVGIDSSHKLPTTTEYNSLATKTYVDTAIDNLPEPMVFKGTLGTGGTITTLPAASASNEGFTYKVITAGTYASQSAKVGDVFISNGTEWVLIPSGDDIEDTWRAINVNGTQLKGNGITSGAINFKNGGNITVTGSGNDITLGVASDYSIPSTTQQTAWTNKQDALDAQTAYTAKGTSTKVPTITTNALGQVTSITETNINFPVTSVNNKTGAVSLSASDVGALPITGGTIKSPTASVPLTIRAGSASGSGVTSSSIGFSVGPTNTTLGYIGVNSSKKPYFQPLGGSQKEIALKSDIPAQVDPAILSDFTETNGTTSHGESYTWTGPVSDVHTLTITFTDGKEHHPFVCYNANNTQVMVELSFTAVSNNTSTITMKTNSKFVGKIYSI